jgi:dTDP-4-dehydrorhamnose 3,5-epimerase
MRVQEGRLPGLQLIEPRVHHDQRGYFREVWQETRYAGAGIDGPFLQDNATLSHFGVLRGIHFQHPGAQGKLVSILWGEIFDVAVDLRVGSPSFGNWAGYHLSARNGLQLYLPPGVGHGALALSETAVLSYKCTETRIEEAEHAIRWDDPDIGIEWPLTGSPTLSPRDATAPRLCEWPRERLPRFEPPVPPEAARAAPSELLDRR